VETPYWGGGEGEERHLRDPPAVNERLSTITPERRPREYHTANYCRRELNHLLMFSSSHVVVRFWTKPLQGDVIKDQGEGGGGSPGDGLFIMPRDDDDDDDDDDEK